MNENFDEAYYQNGSERGTQYRDYLEGAKLNRTYFEVAESVVKLLRPRRTLEIGCATGVIVGHLRTFEVDAHGIDVSEWAVQHRVTDTVEVGSAESLPFENDYFDVVYSVHALEHLTEDAKEKAFAELSRVCSRFQFHMMPMLDSGPYVGDRFGHLVNLRTDPTHNLLYDRKWWIAQFHKQGFTDTGLSISMVHDNAHYELSSCQLLMSRTEVSPDLLRRVADHNHRVAGELSLALNGKPGPGLDVHIERLRKEAPSGLPLDGLSTAPAPKRVSAISATNSAELESADDVREFLAAKVDSQKHLVDDLKKQIERIPLLKTQVRELEQIVAASGARLASAQRELRSRHSELANLTKTLLDAEESSEEHQRTAERLLQILRAIMADHPWWWAFMPTSWRRDREGRRLKRLGAFDADAYAAQYPDVLEGGQQPLRHYIFHGVDEMRRGIR